MKNYLASLLVVFLEVARYNCMSTVPNTIKEGKLVFSLDIKTTAVFILFLRELIDLDGISIIMNSEY